MSRIGKKAVPVPAGVTATIADKVLSVKGPKGTLTMPLADDHMTMVVVTHEMGFAREVADRVVVMDAGAIIEVAPPTQLFAAPEHPRTQAFLSKIL